MPRKRTGAPKTGNLALIAGTDLPDTSRSAHADSPKMAPEKPESVAADKDLNEVWNHIVPQLDAAGLLTSADAMAVEMSLRHFVMARRASVELADEELSIPDPKNMRMMKNPKEAIFRMESAQFLDYAKQLGMTFMSRARTPGKNNADDGDQDNPFSATGS